MKIGFIGCGNMGSAIASAICRLNKHEILLSDNQQDKIKAFAEKYPAKCSTNEDIAASCDYIFLAVKPNALKNILAPLAPFFKKNPSAVIITMAAGISIEKTELMLPENTAVIRIMPNTPVAVGEGMVLYCTNSLVKDESVKQFQELLSDAGTLSQIDERLIDAASALSGCGPAFVYMFIDALADGAVEYGLTRAQALELATQTVLGSAKMVAKTGKHPSQLREEVCSPGGSTIEGVYSLEKNAFKGTVMSAISASYQKTKLLGKE